MAYCKKFLILFLILFILIFNLLSVRVFCVESEEIEFSSVTGIHIRPNVNFFNTAGAQGEGVGYVLLEPGYIYTITNNTTDLMRYVAVSNQIPVLNGTYDFLTTLGPSESYSYIADGSNDYLYFDFSSYQNITLTREKIQGQTTAISDLVDNVGPNVLWGIFGNTTSYILIVVSVALGLFLLVSAIRGISKTKSKF